MNEIEKEKIIKEHYKKIAKKRWANTTKEDRIKHASKMGKKSALKRWGKKQQKYMTTPLKLRKELAVDPNTANYMNVLGTWKGQSIESLDREELLEVVQYLIEEVKQMRPNYEWMELNKLSLIAAKLI